MNEATTSPMCRGLRYAVTANAAQLRDGVTANAAQLRYCVMTVCLCHSDSSAAPLLCQLSPADLCTHTRDTYLEVCK